MGTGSVRLPTAAAMVVARATELWGHLGGKFVVPRGWVRVLLEDRRVDIEAATRDLGYRPRSLADGLRETIAWLGSSGLAPVRCPRAA